MEDELWGLTIDDISGLNVFEENNTSNSWFANLFLPGFKGAIINTFHTYRAHKGDIQEIKDTLDQYLEETKSRYNLLAITFYFTYQNPAFPLDLFYYKPRRILEGLIIQAALASHQEKHKAYPDALNELDKQILPDIPNDPCTDEPFIYKKVGNDYLLYSVGLDKIDDGGLENPEAYDDVTGHDYVIHAPAEQ